MKQWLKVKEKLIAAGKHSDLVVKYKDAQGRTKWKGTKKLRASQFGTHLLRSTDRLCQDVYNPNLFLMNIPYQVSCMRSRGTTCEATNYL